MQKYKLSERCVGKYKSESTMKVQQLETELSLTNRITHLCKCNDMADLLEHPSPYVLPN